MVRRRRRVCVPPVQHRIVYYAMHLASQDNDTAKDMLQPVLAAELQALEVCVEEFGCRSRRMHGRPPHGPGCLRARAPAVSPRVR